MPIVNDSQRHDIWYLKVETVVGGERRGFSRQIRSRPDRYRTVPLDVDQIGMTFLREVLDESDVHPSFLGDFPYRSASYDLLKNGVTLVSSFSRRPIRPEIWREDA